MTETDDDLQQRPEDIPDHDPASVTPDPLGPPTTSPVVGQPWQPPIPVDNPLDADPLI